MAADSEIDSGIEKAVRKRDLVLRRLLVPSLALALAASALLIYGAVSIAVVSGKGSRVPAQRWVDLTEPAGGTSKPRGRAGADEERPLLRIAIAPVISPKKSLPLYEGLASYLSGSTGRDAEIVLRDTYAQVSDLVRYRGCEAAFVCTSAYVQGQRDFGMQAIAIPVVEGETRYRSLIIVPQRSEARSLHDLKGKRFASADILSTSGWLYAAHQLRVTGCDPDRFFSAHVITGSHDRSVQAVATEYVDGAAVDSIVYRQMTEEDPSLRDRMRVIHQSEPFGMPPIVVHPRTDAQLVRTVTQALLHMHENDGGRAALSQLHMDRFVRPQPAAYDNIREMMDVVWGAAR